MAAERLVEELPFVSCVQVSLATEEQAASFGFVIVRRVMQGSPSTVENHKNNDAQNQIRQA
jgi:hypothetical protein